VTFPVIPPGRAPSTPADPVAQAHARLARLARNQRVAQRRGVLDFQIANPIFDAVAGTSTGLPVSGAWVPIPCTVAQKDDDNMMTAGHAQVQRPGWYWARGSSGFLKASSNGTQLSIALSSDGTSSGIYLRSEDTDNATISAFPVLKTPVIPLHFDAGDGLWLVGTWTGGVSGNYQTSSLGSLLPSLSLVCIRLD
jgi:hypothetical protein